MEKQIITIEKRRLELIFRFSHNSHFPQKQFVQSFYCWLWNFPTYFPSTNTLAGARRGKRFSLPAGFSSSGEKISSKIFRSELKLKILISRRLRDRRRWCAHVHEKNPTIPLFPQPTHESRHGGWLCKRSEEKTGSEMEINCRASQWERFRCRSAPPPLDSQRNSERWWGLCTRGSLTSSPDGRRGRRLVVPPLENLRAKCRSQEEPESSPVSSTLFTIFIPTPSTLDGHWKCAGFLRESIPSKCLSRARLICRASAIAASRSSPRGFPCEAKITLQPIFYVRKGVARKKESKSWRTTARKGWNNREKKHKISLYPFNEWSNRKNNNVVNVCTIVVYYFSFSLSLRLSRIFPDSHSCLSVVRLLKKSSVSVF